MGDAADDAFDAMIQHENDLWDQKKEFEKMSEDSLKYHVGVLFKRNYDPDKYTDTIKNIILQNNWSEKQKNAVIVHLKMHNYFNEEFWDQDENNDK